MTPKSQTGLMCELLSIYLQCELKSHGCDEVCLTWHRYQSTRPTCMQIGSTCCARHMMVIWH